MNKGIKDITYEVAVLTNTSPTKLIVWGSNHNVTHNEWIEIRSQLIKQKRKQMEN